MAHLPEKDAAQRARIRAKQPAAIALGWCPAMEVLRR